jgi:hypothetical protein
MSSNSKEKNEEDKISNNKNKEEPKVENIKENEDINNEDDDESNLAFNSKLFLNVDKNEKKESTDYGIKFSIDDAPQQRIHEYLNNDLITALDNNLSNPQTPIIPIDNNNNLNEQGKYNINQIPKINLGIEEKNIQKTPLSLLQINKFDYTKMKNNKGPISLNMDNNLNKNNKSESQQGKEKQKKPFEIRAGDWTCFDCNNLNFAFRTKCNRCGLPKEISMKKYNLGLIQNLNLQGTTNIMYYPKNFNNP